VAGAEQARLDGPDAAAWRRWGPYLAERAWGTVREDYSADGDAWSSFPHDHARSRTYRWNEDGLAGLCDDSQRLCLALAFWNGVDPILKERVFGLTGPEGNHGEDAKEYWWYLDSTPTHSWMRWRYVCPQRAFPYEELVRVASERTRLDPEYELADTGVLDGDRYFDIAVDHAKDSPDDVCIRVRVTNAGPEAATLHLLPTLWFRDTWSWGPDAGAATVGDARPGLTAATDAALTARHPELGELVLTTDTPATALFCDNATNTERLWGVPGPAYPKDGINDHVVSGAPTVNPARTGTKAALHHVLDVAAGATVEVRLRLAPPGPRPADLGAGWEAVVAARAREADEFYAALGAGATADEAHLLRSVYAGMLWSKQYYAYVVRDWLAGDPGRPPPPASRLTGRNSRWQSLDVHAVVSMPDTWEYPWFAAWDLAFHCVTLAAVDPAFAKSQLAMVVGAGWMHPGGQVPAYEWDFGAVNPPVHAWAALRVFRIDGSRDTAWLRGVFERLLVNSTWWITKNDPGGLGVFTGGFLGMDDIGPFDRDDVPLGYTLEEADATGWMAQSCLCLLEIAAVLAAADPTLQDMALMFFEEFTLIARAGSDAGLWDAEDGFDHDQLVRESDGSVWPVRVRSVSGLVPLFAAVTLGPDVLAGFPALAQRAARFAADHPLPAAGSEVAFGTAAAAAAPGPGGAAAPGGSGAPAGAPALLAFLGRDRLLQVLRRVSDPAEFLSPHGIRSLSAAYRGDGYVFRGAVEDGSRIDYEPAESTTALFGGNSNWRGPVWLPVNVLLVDALRRYDDGYGDTVRVEHPTGSGRWLSLAAVADDLSDRLLGLYLPDAAGRRAVWGAGPTTARFRDDARWRDSLLFFEYFNGDDGAGLGASHQTGWTGLLADLLLERLRARRGPA